MMTILKSIVSKIFPSRIVLYVFIGVVIALSSFWWWIGNLRVDEARDDVRQEISQELHEIRVKNYRLSEKLRVYEDNEKKRLDDAKKDIKKYFEIHSNPRIPESTLCLLDDTCTEKP